MKIKISDIKVNPGRREVKQEPVEELAKSIAAVGLLNPITLTGDHTLVAGLHRLEAAKQLGWTEIESTIVGMSSLQVELAEIDENIVRTRLTHQELGEQFLRRKELYEMIHPETKAGTAQAAGMNRAVGNNVGAKLASRSKSFVEDTSEKTGMSKRVVSRLLQIANNLTEDAKRIVKANNMTQDTALKLSRLHYTQQVEAASLLADGKIQSVEQYQQERREKSLRFMLLCLIHRRRTPRRRKKRKLKRQNPLMALRGSLPNLLISFLPGWGCIRVLRTLLQKCPHCRSAKYGTAPPQ